MIKFTALVIALVLAPGLQSAAVSNGLITTYPLLIDVATIETRPLPLPVVIPELGPEVPVVIPELEPVIPVVVPETKPIPAEANPCEACFSYMATLIDQLTETVEPQLPEFLPEAAPVEVELRPLPILTEAQAEVELALQNRPLPEYIIR